MKTFEVTFVNGSSASVKVTGVKADSFEEAPSVAREMAKFQGLNVDSFIAGTGIDLNEKAGSGSGVTA